MFNYILTFLISMVPIIELRGAIPYGLANGGDVVVVTLLSVIGNILPVPFLIIFGGKVLNWLAKFPKFGKPFR
ncbi:MAG: small multi-drug export protein [Clostridia bacterium]|nr:small multi-drug export protein [Clostridia bacterium]